jgi:hypothetical protein
VLYQQPIHPPYSRRNHLLANISLIISLELHGLTFKLVDSAVHHLSTETLYTLVSSNSLQTPCVVSKRPKNTSLTIHGLDLHNGSKTDMPAYAPNTQEKKRHQAAQPLGQLPHMPRIILLQACRWRSDIASGAALRPRLLQASSAAGLV